MNNLIKKFQKFLAESVSKRAVVIKGNPMYVGPNGIQRELADKFYSDIESILRNAGYTEVEFVEPDGSDIPEADLWIGHSKGEGMLIAAENNNKVPSGTKLIYLSDYEPGYIQWRRDAKRQMAKKGYKSWAKFIAAEKPLPNKEHYMITDKLRKELEGG